MLSISGYNLNATIDAGLNTTIFMGTELSSQQPVILKVLSSDYPTPEAIARLKHEYSIAVNLNHPSIVKALQLQSNGHQLAIILQDFGGISLKQYLATNKLTLETILQIAIAITNALIYLHEQQIIHKDIKPGNIIINPETLETKLTDFSIASTLSKETPQMVNLEQLEGTLPYLSPEQSGRMNRFLDFRTDFYSLGVTLYELLTRKLPFISNNPLELVHCHIAKQPKSIQKLNPDIPSTVCAIVEKLMAKNAEDRYQSAKGLLADLERCQKQLANSADTIEDFIPGKSDTLSQFIIPQKLYGREEQVTSLLECFERVAKGNTEFILVSGYSGIGKTSVINEIKKPITSSHGYFISGKFDQFKRDIPYSPFIQAFSLFIKQILTESTQKLQVWKVKIQDALGNNGQVIIDVIPEVELIIGKQSEVPRLTGSEAQNRLNLVFQQFISIFCASSHPLVIFLDDLQWADSATLNLIQSLVCNTEIQYLLLIGAYRDNEVNNVHPLTLTIEEIENYGTNINQIILKPLQQHNVIELVEEALKDNKNKSLELAELIFHKTGGNPFFINQLLQSLYQESLLNFDFDCQQWQWDIKKITVIGMIDKGIVELVASRIQKLSESTQEILKIAACIGDKFTLDILSIVNQKSSNITAKDLYPALQLGLILPLNENYLIPLALDENDSENLDYDTKRIGYKFLHDRVQQAAYSLIPDRQKHKFHLKIGDRIKESTPQEELSENILDIVNQLNFGVDFITTQEDKTELAELNLMAGKKAKNNAAYQAAQKYLDVGLKLINQDSWFQHYHLTLSLYIESSECLYINSNFEKSQELADIALSRAQTVLDKAKIYEIKIRSLISQNQMLRATETGVEILNILGVKLPKQPKKVDVVTAVLQTKLTLGRKKIGDLAYLPSMNDSYKLAAMQILVLIDSAASMAGSLHFPLTTLLMVRLSIKHGNSTFSTYAYAVYGAILCDKLGDIESGYKFGKLALYLVDKLNALSLKCKIFEIVNTLIIHFKDHLNLTIKQLSTNIQVGLETGDIQFSLYSTWGSIYHQLLVGNNLSLVSNQIDKYSILIKKLDIESVATSINIASQAIIDLTSNHFDVKNVMNGQAFNEREMVEKMQNNPTFITPLPTYKIMINYLFDQNEEVIKNTLISEQYHQKNPGFFFYHVNNFYYSLALLAQYPKTALKERKQYLKQVAVNQKKMKLWAHHAACNYQHKYDLVEAEKARILGKSTIAADLYDKAIAGAKANKYTQEEAIANELAAKFYLDSGKTNIAKIYITEAYYGYIKWGAYAKVQDLEEKYSQLIIRSTVQTNDEIDVTNTISRTVISTKTGSTTSSSQILDLASVMKASEEIQASMQMEILPSRLLRIIIQNAAAQKGCILLEKNHNFYIEAIEDIKDDNTTTLQSIPFEKSDIVPNSVINYVSRTQKPSVIHDALLDPIIKNDPYVKKHKCKSILCLPIQSQGKMIGVFYLENNLVSGAFTPKHLEIVKILATQAAISIQNARLFTREKQKSQQLQESLAQLEITQEQVVEKASDLEEALRELQNMQTQLVHTEKISALGQLVAGVAHEVNNPVSFISSNLSHANQYVRDLVNHLKLYQEKYGEEQDEEIIEDAEMIDLEFLLDDLPKMLSSMKLGTVRIKDIMQSLRNFSRNDGDQKRTVDITEGIDSTILILGHRLKAGPERPAIKIIKEYDTNLPKIECYPGQLNQVFMNLSANAIDALDESNQGKTYQEIEKNPNTITIRTIAEYDWVQISIKDNGPGMSEESRQKLFKAFFTTKPEGKGTGLGLSISYQIVTEKHGGTLDCISQPGEGAEFIIRIPVKEKS